MVPNAHAKVQIIFSKIPKYSTVKADHRIIVPFLGAAGIIFPHIDTAEQAAEAVSKCRYATSGGDRSLSPCALVPGITDTAPPGSTHDLVADSHVAVICQIESRVRHCSW
jgi:2-keto-3-deoxy-L-rhamnonate aldolase RhmA